MRRSTLFSIVLGLLVVGTVLVAGCTGDRIEQTAPAQPTVRTPAATHTLVTTAAAAQSKSSVAPVTAMKTCAQLGGDICTSGEDCSGSYLNNAKDSFSCCSKPCSGTGTAVAVITIETPGQSQTYVEMGSISP